MSIILDKINYSYSEGTAYQIQALKNVNFEIKDGQFIGVIGHTGSGKSTLTQLLNGLLKATSGHIYVDGEDIYDEDYDMKNFVTRSDLYFSIRITNCSRQPISKMSALDRRIRDLTERRWSCVLMRLCVR